MATSEYRNLVEAGFIDPAKVTRSALQNAASIAALFLATEVVIADKPEKETPQDAGGLLSSCRQTLQGVLCVAAP